VVGSKEEFMVVMKGLWSGCPNDVGMKELLVGSNEEMMVVIT